MNTFLKSMKFGGLLLLLVAASQSMAFVTKQGRPEPARRESSQEALAQQQRFNGVQPEAGVVNYREDLNQPKAKPIETQEKAAAAIIQNDPTGHGAQILRQAEVDIHMEKSQPVRSFIWAILLVASGLVVVVGLRFYADRVVPAMPTKRDVKW